MSIEEIIGMIIRNEGGYVNHPNDRGGPTNMGITQKTLSNYLGYAASIDQVKNLTYDTAFEIYERNYIIGPRINTLDPKIQPAVADASVLYGPKRAIKFLQNIVNEAGFGPISVDGVLGPNTRRTVERTYEEMGPYFINAYVEERIMFCERIVANNPSQSVFLKGWINRANKFRVEVPS
jgi:lysozyme family protein